MVNPGIRSIAYRLPSASERVEALVAQGIISRGEYLAMGVESIPVLGPKETALDLATEAARDALKHAELDADDVDLLVFFSSTYRSLPGVSQTAILQHNLDLCRAHVLGIADMYCAGFHCALEVVKGNMASDPSCRVALIVAADASKKHYVPKGAILSDGASALVLEREWPIDQPLVTYWVTEGLYHDLYRYDETVEGFVVDNVQKLEEFARGRVLYHRIREIASTAIHRLGIDWSELKYLVFENYGRLFQHNVINVLQLPADRFFFDDLRHRGHAGCSDIVISFARLLERRCLQSGDKVLLFSIGLGHTWACSVLEH